MRNPLNPVDRATLRLDLSYVVGLMFPSESTFGGDHAVYQRKLELVSHYDLTEGDYDLPKRMEQASSLAHLTAQRLGLEAVFSDSSWDIYGACHVHVALHRPTKQGLGKKL